MTKYGKILNLKNVKADILDTDPFSTYFVISELPTILTSGKNAFCINGSNLLRVGSEILIEAIDVNGNSIYIELASSNTKVSYREGMSIIYSIRIYDDTPVGLGSIYLIGTDLYGKIVKWKKDINIDPSIINKSKVRFYNQPTINVLPIVNITSETNVTETTEVGTFIGTAIKPQQNTPIYYYDSTREEYEYILRRTDSGRFTSDMNGRTIVLNGKDHIIQEVINNSTLKLSYPIVEDGIIVNSSGNFSLTYFPYDNPSIYRTNPYKSIGTAEILFRNLETFTGKIYRYKIYRSSINAPYDSECISTGIFYGSEFIYDTETPFRHQAELGKIYNQQFLNEHWFVKNSTSCGITYSPEIMVDSMKTYGFDSVSDRSNYIILKSGQSGSAEYIPYNEAEYSNRNSPTYNSNFIRLYKNIEYVFSAKVISDKSFPDRSSKIEFFLKTTSPSANNNKLYTENGIKIHEIIDKNYRSINYGTVTTSFMLEEDCCGTLIIYPQQANYTISNISIKPYVDFSYGPDVFSVKIPFDARAKNEGNKITCELFDIDNKLVIGNLSTIQYFDPLGITYPFNVMVTQEQINYDLSVIEASISELNGEITTLSGSQQALSQSVSANISEINNELNILSGSYYNLSQSIAGNSVDASEVSYSNVTYPTVEIALNHLLYVPINVSYFSGGGTYETGSYVSTVNLSWAYNKSPTTQTISGETISILDRAVTSTANTYTNKTYTLSYGDGTTFGTSTTSVTFLPKRYWGVSVNDSVIDAYILSMSSELSSSRNQNRVFDCSGGKYFYLIYPASEGLATFTVNGLANNAFDLTVRSLTNSSGFTQNYNIYRSLTIQFGSSINVTVT